jgi:hypothetical protein
VMISGSAPTSGLKQNTAIMAEFVLPITLFAGILIIGALLGSIVYFATYFQNSHYDKSSSSSKMFDSMRWHLLIDR